jgi:acyl-CoA thioesterase
MSTKTIKQRIALVAVTTLTAGFLSVVSSPAANAANNEVMISLVASTTGSASVNATEANARQVGWVAPTNTVGLASASLDHAMWFHRPARVDDWLLYVQDSPSAQNGRGLSQGKIFDREGRLIASVAQEGMIRIPEVS